MAQDLSPVHEIASGVQIHGFGSWNSGSTTNANQYLGGQHKGSSLSSNAGVNLSGSPSERIFYMMQVKFDFDGETQPSLEYAFAEYKFFDALKLRAGQVRQPFGLYTEVIDIGTMRPFLTAPQAVYGPAANIAEAYRGLGLTGSIPLILGMSIDYDLYGGGLNRKEYELVLDAYRASQGRRSWESVSGEDDVEITERVVGGRFVLGLPIPGLRIGASGYHGRTGELSAGPGWVATVGYSLEYLANRISLRSEAIREIESDHDRQNGWYYEGAVRLIGGLQVAGLYDRATVHPKDAPASCATCVHRPAFAASLLDHKEMAGGLNYVFSPNFVLKLSYHNVEGNRFALPERDTTVELLMAAQAAGSTAPALPTETHAVLLGAQFSF